MAIVISPTIPLVAAQGVTADVVLQPGSVISARVLQILGNDTVRIAIGNQSIDVLSQVPLQAGQTLQLSVSQGADGSIRLAVVNQGDASASPDITNLAGAAATADSVTLAPSLAADLAAQTISGIVAPKIQLTPQEALAVSVAAQTAATQQTSLAPLFANLDVAAGLDGLPLPVQQAVAQLLTQRISLDQGLTGDAIRQAFQSSGLFLEASLASGSLSSSAPTPDLKAALIVLRQVLTTSLDNAPPTLNAPTPAAGMQQGTTAPAAAQQGAAPATIEVQQGTSPPATAAAQGAAPVVVVLAQGTQPSIQVSSQPVAMIVEPEALAMGSSALAPLLASGITASGASLQAPMAQDALTLAANAVISPTSMPAGEVARAAVSSAALNLLQEVLQAGPLTAGNPSGLAFGEGMMLSLLPVVTGVRTSVVDDAEFARTNMPPPPISGALPAAQPVMPATLASNSSPQTAMQHLLADTDAAIARQTLLQVASLPDRVDVAATQLDPAAPRWNFEIPFATRQGTAMAQFEISRDGSGSEVDAAKRVWRARFSLDVEPAGPVHAQVSLSGERTSVRMWAERPATADQLRAGVSQLSQALSRAELQPGDIVVRDGAPLQSAPARAGHFLDRAS
jgi:flagellar hook-length control protein FliK